MGRNRLSVGSPHCQRITGVKCRRTSKDVRRTHSRIYTEQAKAKSLANLKQNQPTDEANLPDRENESASLVGSEVEEGEKPKVILAVTSAPRRAEVVNKRSVMPPDVSQMCQYLHKWNKHSVVFHQSCQSR